MTRRKGFEEQATTYRRTLYRLYKIKNGAMRTPQGAGAEVISWCRGEWCALIQGIVDCETYNTFSMSYQFTFLRQSPSEPLLCAKRSLNPASRLSRRMRASLCGDAAGRSRQLSELASLGDSMPGEFATLSRLLCPAD